MEIKSFLAGMFFLVGMQLLLPLINVKIAVSLPGGAMGGAAAGIICLLIAYYLFKGN